MAPIYFFHRYASFSRALAPVGVLVADGSGRKTKHMTTTLRTTRILRTALFAALAVPAAYGGCGDTRTLQGPFTFVDARLLAPTTPDPVRPQVTADASSAIEGPSIVGMWNITFASLGNTGHNPSIPDGATIDFGYSQWHSDGTEIMNSGGHSPATQNFCLGVWARTGFASYQLNHFALSYDLTTGVLNGKVQIQETIALSADGNSLTGTFAIDVYDPTGAMKVDHVQGTVTAKRVTVTTTLP
jgi:hypothetical protein